jgi:glycosyltransferase involved in cell wall biosynthesis
MIQHGFDTIRLAVLFDRIGPYHHARLQAAARVCDVTGVEFSAVDRQYAWDPVDSFRAYERKTLWTDQEAHLSSLGALRSRLDRVLGDSRPDALAIPGWATRGALSTLRWCRTTGTPAILMADSWDPEGTRKWWTESIKRRLVSLYDAALVAGTPQRHYLTSLGMDPQRIFTGYDVVDNEHFAQRALEARRSAATLRRQLGLPRHYFLSVCRFIPEKNLHRLLLAYAAYRARARSNAWHLVLVGDGPLKNELTELRRQLRLETSVHFVRFQQYQQLPAYYGLAEALVLPSLSETWGLVVNEAMAAGLPVLVSDRCGCAQDLVRDGFNGFSFDPRATSDIRDAMLRLSGEQCNRQAMGEYGRQSIRRWSVQSFADNLKRAATMALTCPRNKANRWSQLTLAAAMRRRTDR